MFLWICLICGIAFIFIISMLVITIISMSGVKIKAMKEKKNGNRKL